MSTENKINTTSEKPQVFVDPDEFSAAEKEAEKSGYDYTLKFRKPFEYNGKKYERLTFEWDTLTGKDGRDIENEMIRLGKAVVAPALSGEYLVRLAAKACTENIGSDAFDYMPLVEYNKVRSAARSFLLKSELEKTL